MKIWERNHENWIKPNLKNKQRTRFKRSRPLLSSFCSNDSRELSQSTMVWSCWSLKENKEPLMDLLAFLAPSGNVKTFQKSPDLSRMQKLVINSRPQDKWRALKWYCTWDSDTWIGCKWNWRIWWRREHGMNYIWAIFAMTVKYSEALNKIG